MFSLIVSGNMTAWETDQLMRSPKDRFKEFSNYDTSAIRLEEPASLERLERVDTLLMYEPGGEYSDVVRFGFLKTIAVVGDHVAFMLDERGRLSRAAVCEFGTRLGVTDNFEFAHNHWTLKLGDIPSGLLDRLRPSPKQTSRRPYEFDVFLSHSSKDKPVVREVAGMLEKAGLRVWLDETNVRPGESIPLALQKGLDRSRCAVFFLSKHSLASEWVTLEHHVTQFRDPANRDRTFIPVLLDDTELPSLIKHFSYIDLRQPDDQKRRKVLEAIQDLAEGRREWRNDTYKSIIRHVEGELWEEIDDPAGTIRREEITETIRNPVFIELFMPNLDQRNRIYSSWMDIKKTDESQWHLRGSTGKWI